VTYASKIGNEDARIDWTKPAQAVHDLVRGLSPFPGAFTTVDLGRGPERLKILRTERAEATGPAGHAADDALTVACGTGAVRLLQIQRSGAKAMSAAEFLRGARVPAGTRFT
jgi:methionyl-tRNA formyltransferase